MKTHSRRTVTVALLTAMALGGTAALAGEGGQHAAQRAKLDTRKNLPAPTVV